MLENIQESMNLKDFKDNFKLWLKELEQLIKAERSISTLKTYRNAINKFINFLETENITEINRTAILEYKKYLMSQKETGQLKINTANSRITILNKFLKDIGLESLKISRIKSVRQTSNNNTISETDYNRLIRWADKLGMEREKLIMQTLAGTGIRISELQSFTVENLKKYKDGIPVYNKKKERLAIVPDKLRKALLSYARKNKIKTGVIFCSSKDPNKMLDKAWIWRKLKYIAGRARVNKNRVHSHSFRHLYAQRYLELYPEDISDLADLLGHSSLETTRLYATLSTQEQKKRANKMFDR